ncbi:hypothetical protein Pmani_027400 [Petrolisthes manimaculis]|uniref:Uncharacterized protein n=1 Tax=Petrolisthes manimaculis TaxID=1843537 RepID=A0AAE1TWV8_9EUCA|nr:hypothetical protein Pmani_027400 [Petrolisthes manimaculis]
MRRTKRKKRKRKKRRMRKKVPRGDRRWRQGLAGCCRQGREVWCHGTLQYLGHLGMMDAGGLPRGDDTGQRRDKQLYGCT